MMRLNVNKPACWAWIVLLTLMVAAAKAQQPLSAKAQARKAQADRERPGVLVLGNGSAAAAAAIQSARSGVATTLLLQAAGFDLEPVSTQSALGVEFTSAYGNTAFDKLRASAAVLALADTVKNLRVVRDLTWTKAAKAGNNWSFRLKDGSTVRPRVLIVAGDDRLLSTLSLPPSTARWQPLEYDNNLYRTSVAAGDQGSFFSLYEFFTAGEENLVRVAGRQSLHMGQAAGATAAYAAFYDTKTSLSNLKRIQGELIHYQLPLMPFGDITPADSNWRAIQMVGLTGMLRGANTGKEWRFLPGKAVTRAEIEQPMRDFYYKAQIWFEDHQQAQMTIGLTLDMIAYVGGKSVQQMTRDLQKNWQKGHHLPLAFDPARVITRREFAELMQTYLPPFNVNVDKTGRVIR